MSSLMLRGFVLGLAVAASPGPIFFLCVRRNLDRGRLYGLVSGLGVATADAFYAAVAAFGLAALAAVFASGRRPLALVGGVALILLGAGMLRKRQPGAADAPAANGRSLALAYISTLGLTVTNPATIISFAALSATLGLGTAGDVWKPAVVVAGVFAGSATWWAVLAIGASALRTRLTGGGVRIIGTVSALIVCALGVLALVGAALHT